MVSLGVLLTAGLIGASPTVEPCAPIVEDSRRYTVCEFNARTDNIALVLNNDAGERLGNFSRAEAYLAQQNRTMVFAMNAGMFSPERHPIGLYVQDGEELQRLNRREGPGNFHMLPNGVFWIDPDGEEAAGVSETESFATAGHRPAFATQSGPMLVIDGRLHPRFNEGSANRFVRNGVGVDGDRVVFAISDQPVNFYSFASLFRDRLGTPNALYLDGAISRLYAPNLERSDTGVPLGPIVVVTRRSESQ